MNRKRGCQNYPGKSRRQNNLRAELETVALPLALDIGRRGWIRRLRLVRNRLRSGYNSFGGSSRRGADGILDGRGCHFGAAENAEAAHLVLLAASSARHDRFGKRSRVVQRIGIGQRATARVRS